MICQLCEKLEVRRLRIEKGIEIFECKNCLLAFTNNTTSLIRLQQSGKDLYDFNGYKKEERKLRKRFNRLIGIITRYKDSGKVLDVGAGFGLFSSILQSNANFKVDLIEPEQKLHYVNKLKFLLYKTTFEKYKSKEKKYDCILMMDVLEHFSNPIANLEKAKSLLKADGILVVQTPNYKSLMAKICSEWAWWMVEDHKFFFSPKSIKLALEKAGFRETYFTAYEDWEDFKKNLDGNFEEITNNLVRKILKAIFFIFFIPFYFLVRKILWQCNYGGLMFLIVRKRN